MEDGSLYQFGRFCLLPTERILLRDGRLVSLTPKAVRTLLVLVRNSGHVVEKNALMSEVWQDEIVEEGNLAQHIFQLRKALSESPEFDIYIETVPRRGYRFVASVREIPGATDKIFVANEDKTAAHGHVLAVLPFNTSAGPTMDHLSDEITECLINAFSKLPQLRVIARNTVFRFKGSERECQEIGRHLRVQSVLSGRIRLLGKKMSIAAELIDVPSGWQLWGQSFKKNPKNVFDIRDQMIREVSAVLRLREKGGGREQKYRKPAMETPQAYHCYREGRRTWLSHTENGLRTAMQCFQQAIELDPNYIAAYAAIIDCYLRLLTRYFLPPGTQHLSTENHDRDAAARVDSLLTLRRDWDRWVSNVEAGRAASDNRTYQPSAHWRAAYFFTRNLYNQITSVSPCKDFDPDEFFRRRTSTDIFEQEGLTADEEAQVLCLIAREQIAYGNPEGAYLMLHRWYDIGEWPHIDRLSPSSSAHLLYVSGALAGRLASSRQLVRGQKHAQALLNGAISLFESLGCKRNAAEANCELARSYDREGLADLARATFLAVLEDISGGDQELKSRTLLRLAFTEMKAGRLHDSLERLVEIKRLLPVIDLSITTHFHTEIATTLGELALAEGSNDLFRQASEHYAEGIFAAEAMGHHYRTAVLENNRGYLLLGMGKANEAEAKLTRARCLFAHFGDQVRCAQNDEALAQLYLESGRLDLAAEAISRSVSALEAGGEEALLAESLRTHARVLSRLGRHGVAKRVLDRAHQLAERCGDSEGVGLALLIGVEELSQHIEDEEWTKLDTTFRRLLAQSQRTSLVRRVREKLDNASDWNQAEENSFRLRDNSDGVEVRSSSCSRINVLAQHSLERR